VGQSIRACSCSNVLATVVSTCTTKSQKLEKQRRSPRLREMIAGGVRGCSCSRLGAHCIWRCQRSGQPHSRLRMRCLDLSFLYKLYRLPALAVSIT
jgi:hypothetical protein